MKIFVKAKPGAKAAQITGGKDGRLIVAVKERPTGGKANRAIEKAIAEYFKVPPSRVQIVSGHASREKVVEISEER